MFEELDLADAALDPLLLAAAFVEERLGKSEELGADLEVDVLVLLVCFDFHLVELDHRSEFRGGLLGLRVGLLLFFVACVDIKIVMAVNGAGAAAASPRK